MKKIQLGWLLIVVVLASCQSSRFMQDDMYFVEIDAKREVREFENARNESKFKTNTENNLVAEEVAINNDYYNYSYTSRLRRFNDLNNTWNYYDPYHTNFYWYNNSSAKNFGQSLYNSYQWWGANMASQNNTILGSGNITSNTKNENNPFNIKNRVWLHSYNPTTPNSWNTAYLNGKSFWNTGLGFSTMYYNSFDNTSYFKQNKKDSHNFSALMQKSGIEKDITERPEIEFAEIRAAKLKEENDTKDTLDFGQDLITVVNNNNDTKTVNENSKLNNNTSNITTTTKRWDNHNTDLKISPNSGNKNDNWSKSGVFSEGSRNNNYEYKGSAIPVKKDKKKEDKKN